jgi:hypothetical protein
MKAAVFGEELIKQFLIFDETCGPSPFSKLAAAFGSGLQLVTPQRKPLWRDEGESSTRSPGLIIYSGRQYSLSIGKEPVLAADATLATVQYLEQSGPLPRRAEVSCTTAIRKKNRKVK